MKANLNNPATEKKKALRARGLVFTKNFFKTKNVIVGPYKTKDKSILTNIIFSSPIKRIRGYFKSREFSKSQLKSLLSEQLYLEKSDFRRTTMIEHCNTYLNYIEVEDTKIKLVLLWDLAKINKETIYTRLLPKTTFGGDSTLVEKEVYLLSIQSADLAFTIEKGNYKILTKEELIKLIQTL